MTTTQSLFLRLMLAAMIGSLAFWMPFLLMDTLSGWFPFWGVAEVILLSLGVPLLQCLLLEILSDRAGLSRLMTAASMLSGVWVSGPFWITLQNTLTPGQGFHMAGAWGSVGFMTLVFPFSTFMMSAYHGSLGALVFCVPAVLIFAVSKFRFFRLHREAGRI